MNAIVYNNLTIINMLALSASDGRLVAIINRLLQYV